MIEKIDKNSLLYIFNKQDRTLNSCLILKQEFAMLKTLDLNHYNILSKCMIYMKMIKQLSMKHDKHTNYNVF